MENTNMTPPEAQPMQQVMEPEIKGAAFNYKNGMGVKVSEEFKQKYETSIKGQKAIKAEGLLVLAHFKGIKSLETNILQYPSQANNLSCIVESVLVGYDWSPIEDKIVEVKYRAIGDASPTNCSSMVAGAFIRMAETRAIARVCRKYTNFDMLCSSEMDSVDGTGEFTAAGKGTLPDTITMAQLTHVKSLIGILGYTPDDFSNTLLKTFNRTDYTNLSPAQGDTLISVLMGELKIPNQTA